MKLIAMTLVLILGGVAMNSVEGAESAERAAKSAIVEAKAWIAKHEARVRPLEKAANLAWWNANISGKDEDFALKAAAQNKLDNELSNPKAFAELQAVQAKLKGHGGAELNRTLQVLSLQYLEKQIDPSLLKEMVELGNDVEKTFNVFRAKIEGKEFTDSEIRKALKESKDVKERKKVWEASKAVGPLVEGKLKRLVALRNQAAKKLGFKDFHVMQLHLSEQSREKVLALFDELDTLTRVPYQELKAEIDTKLAADYGISVSQLRPWHYHDPFFQEMPSIFKVDLDAPYAGADLIKLSESFYSSIGLPIDDIIKHSDLLEKAGKSPHAFCTDIDREGDVRVLANIVPNSYWMSTMLHELGHGVYSSKNIPASLTYPLRTEAHILTTEGVAMLFGRFATQAAWLQAMGIKLSDPKAFDEAGSKKMRASLLIFSRWTQVMLRFEAGLYENPGQDLNRLWWDLVEQYQGIPRPEGRNAPDYASKIHVVSAPAYYHNYMMGELFASQLHHSVVKGLYPDKKPGQVVYVGNPKVGEFFKSHVFAPGRSLRWDEYVKKATGSPLSAKAFAEDFKPNP